MKRLTMTITMDCPDDVPPHVLAWMAGNLRAYVWDEFVSAYDPAFVDPPYAGPPIDADGTVDVRVRDERETGGGIQMIRRKGSEDRAEASRSKMGKMEKFL